MSLSDEISRERNKVHTDSYPMSIGELANLYRDGEIYIYPEFQRVFRWTNEQKSRLIESILLGIPLPPIFVSQRPGGIWDVVDGVQRLSTLFQFMGILRDPEDNLVPAMSLYGTDFLPSLEGWNWDTSTDEGQEIRLAIKRTKMDINIVLKESGLKTKYELFMRLNTAGTPLSPQEVRNCLMIMAYPALYGWVSTLAENEDFITSIALSDNATEERYEMELVLRFLIFSEIDERELHKVGDIGEFINSRLAPLFDKYSNPTWRSKMEEAFSCTFRAMNSTLESNAFRRYKDGSYKGGFSIAAFEAIAIGHGNAVLCEIAVKPDKVANASRDIWAERHFQSNSGSGVRASSRISKTIPFGRELFKP